MGLGLVRNGLSATSQSNLLAPGYLGVSIQAHTLIRGVLSARLDSPQVDKHQVLGVATTEEELGQ